MLFVWYTVIVDTYVIFLYNAYVLFNFIYILLVVYGVEVSRNKSWRGESHNRHIIATFYCGFDHKCTILYRFDSTYKDEYQTQLDENVTHKSLHIFHTRWFLWILKMWLTTIEFISFKYDFHGSKIEKVRW